MFHNCSAQNKQVKTANLPLNIHKVGLFCFSNRFAKVKFGHTES